MYCLCLRQTGIENNKNLRPSDVMGNALASLGPSIEFDIENL